MSATGNLLRSSYRRIRWTAVVPAVAVVLAGTLSDVLPVHAQHEHRVGRKHIADARKCAIPETVPPATRKHWAGEKEKLVKARQVLGDRINKKLSERCKGVEANSKQAKQCEIRFQKLLDDPEVGELNGQIEYFCNRMTIAAFCSAEHRTAAEESSKKYFCRLVVPQPYILNCVDTAITGFEYEKTTPSVCSLDDDRARKKACFNCGDAYFRQLQSAQRNPAEMTTPGTDRNKQSAVQQSNAAYASCWAQSRENCSDTCAGRLFVQIVPVDNKRGCLPPL